MASDCKACLMGLQVCTVASQNEGPAIARILKKCCVAGLLLFCKNPGVQAHTLLASVN